MAEFIDPVQAAWAKWLSKQWFDRDAVEPAHRAFIAGWKAAEENKEGRQT